MLYVGYAGGEVSLPIRRIGRERELILAIIACRPVHFDFFSFSRVPSSTYRGSSEDSDSRGGGDHEASGEEGNGKAHSNTSSTNDGGDSDEPVSDGGSNGHSSGSNELSNDDGDDESASGDAQEGANWFRVGVHVPFSLFYSLSRRRDAVGSRGVYVGFCRDLKPHPDLAAADE